MSARVPFSPRVWELWSKLEALLVSIVGLLVLIALHQIFIVSPVERVMGAVQKIFYFHVGAAFATYLAVGLLVVGSVTYLISRRTSADSFGVASGEVAFLFATIVLLTGMIWGKAAWNTWFRWEPRLVSFLFLWLMTSGYILLRHFGDSQRIGVHSAILGICTGAITPLVVYSVKLLPQVVQLHPEVVERGGLHPDFRLPFFISTFAIVSLALLLVSLRTRIELVSRIRN